MTSIREWYRQRSGRQTYVPLGSSKEITKQDVVCLVRHTALGTAWRPFPYLEVPDHIREEIEDILSYFHESIGAKETNLYMTVQQAKGEVQLTIGTVDGMRHLSSPAVRRKLTVSALHQLSSLLEVVFFPRENMQTRLRTGLEAQTSILTLWITEEGQMQGTTTLPILQPYLAAIEESCLPVYGKGTDGTFTCILKGKSKAVAIEFHYNKYTQDVLAHLHILPTGVDSPIITELQTLLTHILGTTLARYRHAEIAETVGTPHLVEIDFYGEDSTQMELSKLSPLQEDKGAIALTVLEDKLLPHQRWEKVLPAVDSNKGIPHFKMTALTDGVTVWHVEYMCYYWSKPLAYHA